MKQLITGAAGREGRAVGHLSLENVKAIFASITTFGSHKKNQNRCQQTRFTGSKYT